MGDDMEFFLFGITMVIVYVWFQSKTKQRNQIAKGSGQHTKSSAKSVSSGTFAFQESGTEPKADAEGRVIVKVKGASNGLAFGVNKMHLDPKLAAKLAGRVNEDEEFAKSIKARVRPDRKSQYANSLIIETLDGQLIGWILKTDSAEAASVFGQLDAAVRQSAPELVDKELTFEVSVRLEGYWNEEDYEDEGGLVWEPDIELMEVRIRVPVEVEIE